MVTDIIELINEKISDLTGYVFDSRVLRQRGVSDYIENLCCERIVRLSSSGMSVNETSSIKSIEDVEIKLDDNHFKVDIKSRDVSKDFSKPNLISIDKARKYLKNPLNHIIYIFMDYELKDDTVTIMNITIKPIENLDWSYLSIQNLGKGQLQIKSTTTRMLFNDNTTRKEWFDRLIKEGKEYYERLILKVSEYINNWNDDTKWD